MREKEEFARQLESVVGATETKTMSSEKWGTIEPFEEGEDWGQWQDRLELYIKMNEIKTEKEVLLLLTSIGKKSYALLSNLCAPAKPSEKDFKTLTDLMKNHLQPRPK